MKRYIYAALMVVYIGLSVVIINYASNWMQDADSSIIASKAKDIAILAAKNFKITGTEVEELEKLEFIDLYQHPANKRLAEMFNDASGYDDIRFAYIMVKLDDARLKYRVTDENKDFYHAKTGTPLDVMWLADVVVGKTVQETLDEDPDYFDDIRRYSFLRQDNGIVFRDKKAISQTQEDEYGPVISGFAPLYTEEGTFVGMLGVDIYKDYYKKNAGLIRMLLLLVFLLPSAALTAIYILIYIMNLKTAYLTADTDPLTSVKNRRFMEKYLPLTIREHHRKQQPLSVIMIDIDLFKAYNDNYGHQKGDVVLIEITRAINLALRDKTDTICRYGGEEFLVILTNTKDSAAEKVADRIKTVVNNLAIKHEYSHVADIVTISQGIYSAVPSNADSEKTFIEYADKALYQAKNSGRNKYVFYTVGE